MEYENKTLSDDELKHWGILGMKWGVRRYQNKDGTLTAKGKKRYKAEMDKLKAEEQVLKNRKSTQTKLNRLAAKKKAVEDQKKELDEADKAAKGKKGKQPAEETPPAKKRPQDMSDEELAYRTRRLQMEKQYEQLAAEPEPVAKGNGFVKEFWNRSATPAIQEAGRQLIKDSLLKLGKKYLGLEAEQGEDYVSTLEKEVKKLGLEKRYKELTGHFEKAKNEASGKTDENSRSDKGDNDSKPNKTNDGSKTGTDNASKSDNSWDRPLSSANRGTWGNSVKNTTSLSSVQNSPAVTTGHTWTNTAKTNMSLSSVQNSPLVTTGRSWGTTVKLLPAPKDDD